MLHAVLSIARVKLSSELGVLSLAWCLRAVLAVSCTMAAIAILTQCICDMRIACMRYGAGVQIRSRLLSAHLVADRLLLTAALTAS